MYKFKQIYIFFLLTRQKHSLFYNLLINIRAINKRRNLGKIYFEKTYIIIASIAKVNITSLKK